jgi:hypothetical protein
MNSADPAATTPTSSRKVKVEFSAFIPASLGKPFKNWPHQTGLKNQAQFDGAVAAVSGTWLPEPARIPVIAPKAWYYATDNREFGEAGAHRVGFSGVLDTADIGSFATKPTIFRHYCSPSGRVRTTDTGIFTSSNETGSVEGPSYKTATVRNLSEAHTDAGSESHIKTVGAAAYAFMETLSPDIDYSFDFALTKAGDSTFLEFDVTHNLFPFYEVLVNGASIYKFASSDNGPSPINLNRSRTWHQSRVAI